MEISQPHNIPCHSEGTDFPQKASMGLKTKLFINKIQQDATVCGYLFTASLFYKFRAPSRPSSGVQKAVNAASGTASGTFLQRDL